ncbi:MAG: hypothetical protein ACUZ8H_04420 [Candidatus Anammoxibacter sp.]
MFDEFTWEISDQDIVAWFLRNAMDHCHIYANFRADIGPGWRNTGNR